MNFDWALFFAQNWPDIIALFSGTLGVWLTIRQTIWCWPAALLSILISIEAFYRQKLYGDMSLQVFYFFAAVYGWIYWNKKSAGDFVVRRLARNLAPLLALATLAQTALYYYLLIRLNGDKPLFDAVLTAASLTATYMMTKKWLENWVVWVIIDAAYMVLYGVKCMWFYALLYLVFAAMAFYGWLKWRKTAEL